MTEAVQQQRSWYKRSLVSVLAAMILGLGAYQMLNAPPRITYGEFFNQLAGDSIASVTFSGTQIDGRFKRPVEAGVGRCHSAKEFPQSGSQFRRFCVVAGTA